MTYTIIETPEYQEWKEKEHPKSKFQIAKRIRKIEQEGHFGTHKSLA